MNLVIFSLRLRNHYLILVSKYISSSLILKKNFPNLTSVAFSIIQSHACFVSN